MGQITEDVRRARVLVVDDSEIELQVLEVVLEGAGFEVAALRSPFELNNAIREKRPDVILLDVQMPALRGDRIAAILKQHRFSRDIPVILYSGSEEEELQRLVAATGATDYFRKTGDFEGLVEKIRRWV